MRPALGPNWDLRLKNNRAYIYRRVDNQAVGSLNGVEAFILGLMNGSRTLAELSSVLALTAEPSGVNALNALISRLGPLLVDGYCRQLPYPPKILVQVKPPDHCEGLRPLPGPRILHWWVTAYCPRRCVYCYVQPKFGFKAKDAVLTLERLKQIFKEASSLGTEILLVSGAEPLLRKDLPEVMGDAIAQGIIPLVTTKYPITKSLAHRFAVAGVRHISLSLDTMDKKESRLLVGNSNYPAQVRRSAQNLLESGVDFSIETVVTTLNIGSIQAVAAFAADSGAKVLQVVPFEPIQSPIGGVPNETMILKHPDLLKGQVAMLARCYPSLNVELFENIENRSLSWYHCDIGKTKLFFLSNGVMHRCYKLSNDSHLRGADLRKLSVAAAWHDPSFNRIIFPPRDAYAGSECWACQRFDKCHNEGRCIYHALISQGQYTARDRSCSGPY